MSPNEPLPIFLPSRYLFPTRSSMAQACCGKKGRKRSEEKQELTRYPWKAPEWASLLRPALAPEAGYGSRIPKCFAIHTAAALIAGMSRSSGSWRCCRNMTLSRMSWEGRKIQPHFPPFCSDLGQEIPLERRQHPLPSQPAKITGTGSVRAAGTPKRALRPMTRSSLWPHSTAAEQHRNQRL